MCGIAGILNRNEAVDREAIRRMTNLMAHRGPDAEGYFIDGKMAFGHRRLSIIDLSASANQPMDDVSGRYVIIFNGEIYNYAEIKKRLPDYPFRTHGDTEVILAGYIKWGPDWLSHLRGMYEFAIWDKRENELFIARDRLGVKPLYYYKDQERFIFSSEIRSILTVGNINREIDHTALSEYFRYQSVPFPFTPLKSIRQMQAGTWMMVKNGEVQTHTYWDPTNKNNVFDFTDKGEVQKRLKSLMLQSVKRRLVSDVPVGAFLSGGIDSSAVVGLMVEAGDTAPHTFNISFDESEYDESVYANLVAKKFNTRHEQIRLKPEIMLDELTNALDAMDIPSGDGINTYVVSRAVHNKGIRVALSGVGGDELFAGYPVFLNFIKLQQNRWLWKTPQMLRNRVARFLGSGEKKDRMRQLLALPSPSIENVYPVLRQLIPPAAMQNLTRLNASTQNTLASQLAEKRNVLARLPYFSQVTAAEYMGYTQQTLLKDTDQMSMANSLEIREPYFDQDLVEFVMSIPDHFKVPVYPKSLLVESLKPLLPDEIVHRKKQGFVFPWKEWMKNELRSFCNTQIQNISQRDFIQGENLKNYWNRFLSGDPDIRWQEIWLFVVLEYWLAKNGLN
ncbi:MAG: asparagine synthase (glutamine-hydrolyzing) [Bacteroidota bacterium]|nr:asparagine synthase (glutamine-hydrolyzing) [Bacteroidota bacterium]